MNVEDDEDDKKLVEATSRYLNELDQICSTIDKKNKPQKSDPDSNLDLFDNAQKFRFMYTFSALFNKD